VGALEGMVGIVTGAGRGIGQGIAFALAREQATVIVLDRDRIPRNRLLMSLRAIGASAEPLICDVSRHEQVDAAIARSRSRITG